MSVAANDEGQRQRLSQDEIWNLTFCLLAWACAISNVTLVVGTSNVVMLSIGDVEGDNNNHDYTKIASLPLGAFMLGSALISCGLTEILFRKAGRKTGFLTGIALGMIGTVLGATSLLVRSPILLIVGAAFFGASNGISFFLRFVAVELVPSAWASKAVTLVVSGGVLAAFAGPETSFATAGKFGTEKNLYYMGVFVMTGVFNVCNTMFTIAIQFPPSASSQQQSASIRSDSTLSLSNGNWFKNFLHMNATLLHTRNFVTPMLVASLSWAIMVLPMSLIRIAMIEAGFSSRQALTAIELHFCGMYAPGFGTGPFIKRFGVQCICFTGSIVSIVSLGFNLASNTKDEGTVVFWVLGMICLGIGWNFGFTGATVWLTLKADTSVYSKSQIQSANDSMMFLFAGVWIFSASYMYDAGGGYPSGWRLLNYIAFGLVALLIVVLLLDSNADRSTERTTTEDPMQNSKQETVDENS